MTTAAVPDVADSDLLRAEPKLVAGDVNLVRVGVDGRRAINLGYGSALVLDFNLKRKRRDTRQRDRDTVLVILF